MEEFNERTCREQDSSIGRKSPYTARVFAVITSMKLKSQIALTGPIREGSPLLPFVVLLIVALLILLERMHGKNDINRFAGWIVVLGATVILSIWVLFH